VRLKKRRQSPDAPRDARATGKSRRRVPLILSRRPRVSEETQVEEVRETVTASF
jgi:hypothetical protein